MRNYNPLFQTTHSSITYSGAKLLSSWKTRRSFLLFRMNLLWVFIVLHSSQEMKSSRKTVRPTNWVKFQLFFRCWNINLSSFSFSFEFKRRGMDWGYDGSSSNKLDACSLLIMFFFRSVSWISDTTRCLFKTLRLKIPWLNINFLDQNHPIRSTMFLISDTCMLL